MNKGHGKVRFFKYWYRFVDVTFAIWQHNADKLEIIHFSNMNPNIQLKTEAKKDSKLSFLDILISRKLGNQVYRKATHTELHLHAKSHDTRVIYIY